MNETYLKNNPEAKSAFKSSKNAHNTSVIRIICRCFSKHNNKLKIFFKSKNYFIEKLSVENIIRQFINFEILKEILLSKEQSYIFNSIPKQSLKALKQLTIHNLFDNAINKNILASDFLQSNKDDLLKIIKYFQ